MISLEKVASKLGSDLIREIASDCPFLNFCIENCDENEVSRIMQQILEFVDENTKAADVLLACVIVTSNFIANNYCIDEFSATKMLEEVCPPLALICATATENGTMNILNKLKTINFEDVSVYDFIVAAFTVTTAILSTKATLVIKRIIDDLSNECES